MDRFKLRAWNKDLRIMEEVDRSSELYLADSKLYEVYYYNTGNGFDRCDDNVTDNYDLMQCTGLKDKNEKLIYEGDIIKIKLFESKLYVVKFIDGGYRLILCNSKKYFYIDITMLYSKEECMYEVIGNIYENFELIKGENT